MTTCEFHYLPVERTLDDCNAAIKEKDKTLKDPKIETFFPTCVPVNAIELPPITKESKRI